MFTEDIAEKVLMNPLREGADELYVAASYATHTMLSWFLTNLELHQHQTLRIAMMIGMVPFYPSNDTIEQLDKLLAPFTEDEPVYQVSLRIMKEILSHIESDDDFRVTAFISILEMMLSEKPNAQGMLIVRRNRDVTQGTGALLSPNDWALGGQYTASTVLTMYKVTGKKGWGGQELWVPNIKLPNDLIYYDVQEDDSST